MNSLLLNLQIISAIWNVIRTQDFYLGPTIKQFDTLLSNFTGSKYALGVSSGTDALILSLKTFDIGTGDEVIVPAISFFSTASAVAWVGAKPVFVDIDVKSYTINPNLIEKAITPKTKAIIPVHLNGGMADMDSIIKIARKHNIFVIADASHAFGARYKNLPISAWGDLVCLSFSFNKKEFGSYGNSGAILTNNDALYKKVKLFRSYGTSSRKEIYSNHLVVSGSHRIDSFQATVLNCKIPYWNEGVQKRRANYLLYKKLLTGVPHLILPEEGVDCFHAGYRFIFMTPKQVGLRKFLRNAGVRSIHYYDVPMPFFPAFKSLGYSYGNFPVSEQFARESISLPTDSTIKKTEVKEIVRLVKTFLKKQK